MGGYERGPQGLGNARTGLPGEEIDETEGTPYDEDRGRTRGLPEHERDDDVAGVTGGGLVSSGATATDYGPASGDARAAARDDVDEDDEDDLTSPDDRESDLTGGFIAGRKEQREELREERPD